MSQHDDFPLTKFLCDLVRVDLGTLTMAELRKRWAKGEYRGINPDHARGYARGR